MSPPPLIDISCVTASSSSSGTPPTSRHKHFNDAGPSCFLGLDVIRFQDHDIKSEKKSEGEESVLEIQEFDLLSIFVMTTMLLVSFRKKIESLWGGDESL